MITEITTETEARLLAKRDEYYDDCVSTDLDPDATAAAMQKCYGFIGEDPDVPVVRRVERLRAGHTVLSNIEDG